MKKLSSVHAVTLLCVVILLFVLHRIYQSCAKLDSSLANNDCEQSLLESDGFICESKAVWNERKQIHHAQDDLNAVRHPDPVFFSTNWESTFHCSSTRRIGTRGDGGKWVCDSYRLKSQANCLIYSVGSNGDFSFETEIKKLIPHCEVHAFDKNVYSCPTNVCTFHAITFGDGVVPNNSQSWPSIVQELNHTAKTIDILKIDIEGAEYSFFPHLFQSDKRTFPRQILVEVHPTNITIIQGFFDLLRRNNYVIAIKENNLHAGPYFFEYAFLKMNPLFFR
ncbi:unnamed protein product [Adineta ricciae]|uniref:Methyltransferase domain-containing protein n=1 Tax=Adineta ricciae TaxID=249248 RepID=A0A813YEH8_ADIRI|nr:unnamed protein product [Adineta ricciae]CAF1348892.1 unnamed protein product [Adineta ricciae]